MSEPAGCPVESCKKPKVLEDDDLGSRESDDDDDGHKTVEGDDQQGKSCTVLPPPPAFLHQYQVVKTILEHLKISDLCRASQVNKQWRDIGRIVRRQRKNLPGVILYHPYLPHTKLAFEYFNKFDVSEEATQLVESGNNGYHSYTRKTRFPDLLKGTRSAINKFLEGTYDDIQMLIYFGTLAFDAHLTLQNASKMTSRKRLQPVLGPIQETIPCLTSFSCGLVASLPDCNKSLEMERKHFPILSGIAVPKVPGLRMKSFAVTRKQMQALKGRENEKQCKSLLGIDKEAEPTLKGIILLHKTSRGSTPVIDTIFQYLKFNPRIALAGGVHDSVHLSESSDNDDSIVAGGVLIFGDELVRVSTVALNESLHSQPESCFPKFEELKSTAFPDGNSFAFMFACNGRGRYMHGRPNVESDLFNSTFPKTPLVGTFTYGEFCHEVAVPFPRPPDGVKPPKRIDFGYNTIFLLVSYKHPIDVLEVN